MVWSKIEQATGKKKYIKRFGNNILITNNPIGATDEIPEGWDVYEKNGYLKIKRER